jgi:hypothetical protein
MQTGNQESKAQAAARMKSQNDSIRQMILRDSQLMKQQIASATIANSSTTQVNIPTQNVGLITGFLLKVVASIFNPAAGSTQYNITPNGPANLLQNVIFTDLQNYQRINTSGWHLSVVKSLRQKSPFGSSTPTDSPMGYGSNWTVIKAPATIAVNTTGVLTMYFWIPCAFSDDNLTGAIYANVVNATMNLQLTFATPAQAVVANTADPSLAVYQAVGATGVVTIPTLTYTLFQFYRDQLPMSKDGPILPSIDIGTMYELKITPFSAFVAGQDNYFGYSNFRHFLSTAVLWNNQLTGVYPANGSDINYFSLRTANTTDLQKLDPSTWKLTERAILTTDAPTPIYLFDWILKPIYTSTQGNMNLVVNPSLVNANASALVGWEDLANINNLLNASALSSN